MRWAAGWLLISGLLAAEVTDPKPSASDYPVHAAAGAISLGAEYMVRSFQGQGQTFVTSDYLVVLVAVYPSRTDPISVSIRQFTLRINGKPKGIEAQSPPFVAASVKYPDWERRPTLVAGGGIGNAGVILGAPQSGRFPGDPTPPEARTPRRPRVPDQGGPGGIEPREKVLPEEIIVNHALPEGEQRVTVCGYLYFPYRKKTKSIRSLELIYEASGGSATLRLR